MKKQKRMSRLHEAAKQQSGSAMIETALILPGFCMLLFGIFAFSMLMVSYLSATYCLRQATRYGSMHSLTSISPASATFVSNLVTSSIFLPLGSAPSITVTYQPFVGATTGNYVGNQIVVTVAWTQSINIPFYSNTLSLQNTTSRMITQ